MPAHLNWNPCLLGLLFVGLLATGEAWGWGSPHGAITQAALSTLPDWQRTALADEYEQLGRQYCYIPDWIFSHPELRPYALMDTKPGVVYLICLHLPEDQTENYQILSYFLGRAVEALRAGQVADGAKYAGTLAHLLEDWGCPAHAVPGDNMFTQFKQFLPPPEKLKYTLLHGPIENASLHIDLADRRPRFLGESVAEAAFNLLSESNDAVLNARSQVIPIVQALYAEDKDAVAAAQLICAQRDAEVVADALYTVMCLGTGRPDEAERDALQEADLSDLMPLEAPHLFTPQSSFFSKPYWGYAHRGVVLAEGTRPVPLVLRVEQDGQVARQTFEQGLGTGTRSVLSYLVPPGVYQRFVVTAGLHADLGQTGHVTLQVVGDDQALATVELTGEQPAKVLDCPVGGVTKLQLVASSAGGDGTGNYVVWGAPRLVK